jgi:hypothetical protein
MTFEVPQKVIDFCAAKGWHNPRITKSCGHVRALATCPKEGTVFVPQEVYFDLVIE